MPTLHNVLILLLSKFQVTCGRCYRFLHSKCFLSVFCFLLYNYFAFHKITSNKLFIVYCLFKMVLHVYGLYSIKRVGKGVPRSLKYCYANYYWSVACNHCYFYRKVYSVILNNKNFYDCNMKILIFLLFL